MTNSFLVVYVLAVDPVNMAQAYAPSFLSVLRTSRNLPSISLIGGSSFCRSNCRLHLADIDAGMTLKNDTNAIQSTFSVQNHSPENPIDTPTFRSYDLPTADISKTGLTFQLGSQIVSQEQQSTSSWKDRLVDVSNVASFLCVLDCTLLPLVSIALPALSWIAGGVSAGSNNAVLSGFSSTMGILPAVSHGIALFFVIPVGMLTTIVNYFFGHKQWRFSITALFGLMLIYVANSPTGTGIANVDSVLTSWGIASYSHGGHVHDACGAIVGAATGMLTHSCGEGWTHRLTNTIGCAFLLGSNHYGKKYMEKQKKGCAASALAEAWGGNDATGRRPICPPGCGCEQPYYGANRVTTNAQNGGEMFFSWDRASNADPRSRRQLDPGQRTSKFKGRFRQ